jgi:hypothetical protein
MAWIAVPLVALAVAAGGWFWMSRQQVPRAAAPPPTVAEPPADAAAPPTAQVPSLQPPAEQDVVKAEEVDGALTRLLGREAVLKFLETTDFPRRFVATLDNLGRDHAPVTVWPVQPAPGRFMVDADGKSQVLAGENALRYAPFVAFAGSINAAQAVELYRGMYPLLEQSYRELGLGSRPLHARVFEVIDLLLATPEPDQPPKLTLTEVKGPISSLRPWTRYEYEDASFQRLAAGQKLLLRMGPEHRKVLKSKLRELRQELVSVSSIPARP